MTKLLTIAIPTYNRSAYLDRCLAQISRKVAGCEDLIELCVSDNASTDSTEAIVRKYIQAGLPIQYHRNTENKGADFNVLHCYAMGTSKYIWVLGDDDLIVNDGIRKALSLLTNNEEFGIVHLNHYFFEDSPTPDTKSERFDVEIYKGMTDFAKRTNYHITFISANIINRKCLNSPLTDIHLGSNLTHLVYSTNALLSGMQNAYVREHLVAGQAENTGGYNLFRVFGTNLSKILRDLPSPQSVKLRAIISNELLLRFFPYWILKLKSGNNNRSFEKAEPSQELHSFYREYAYYWSSVYLIDKLPLSIGKGYFFIIRSFSYLRKKIMSRNLNFELVHLKTM